MTAPPVIYTDCVSTTNITVLLRSSCHSQEEFDCAKRPLVTHLCSHGETASAQQQSFWWKATTWMSWTEVKAFLLHTDGEMSATTNQWGLQWWDQRLVKQQSQRRMDKPELALWPLTPLTLFLHPGHHQYQTAWERKRKKEARTHG